MLLQSMRKKPSSTNTANLPEHDKAVISNFQFLPSLAAAIVGQTIIQEAGSLGIFLALRTNCTFVPVQKCALLLQNIALGLESPRFFILMICVLAKQFFTYL